MQAQEPIEIANLVLDGEAATIRLGADLALAAKPGDLILLDGDLGAGKSTLARAFLRGFYDSLDLEVPSPTYTLVQTYEGAPPVYHADLYRTRASSEVDELGLTEALETGIVLVEWPERAPHLFDEAALIIRLTGIGAKRNAIVSARHSFEHRFVRTLKIRDFLERNGAQNAVRKKLTGDASTRSYETIHQGNDAQLILMNAPRMPDGPPIRDGLPYSRIAHLAESVTPFAAIDRALIDAGFCAPLIHSADLENGLLLIEDLGRDTILDDHGKPIAARYQASGALLADFHQVNWPEVILVADGISHEVPAYSRRALLIETELFTDWYWPELRGSQAPEQAKLEWREAWNAVLDSLHNAEQSLVLRDYHSPNIIWREHENGTDKIGLIDFQDAVSGPSAYDVASLARDARVDISPELEASIVEAYVGRRLELGAFDRKGFDAAFAIMAAQRNAKILGIFHRLNRRDGKPAYLKHLPRIERYFGRSLNDPAMAP
ncbi:MAG: tRNA (adenosine(37)-N6)-threonylcarbamoyltransferase complex ATPase subunit type 1 TsaE, partial [Notoacmeibacter sp.]